MPGVPHVRAARAALNDGTVDELCDDHSGADEADAGVLEDARGGAAVLAE